VTIHSLAVAAEFASLGTGQGRAGQGRAGQGSVVQIRLILVSFEGCKNTQDRRSGPWRGPRIEEVQQPFVFT
jgi:hypothetical protein